MSSTDGGTDPTTKDDVLAAFDGLEYPVCTAPQLAERLPVKRRMTLNHLQDLEADGAVVALKAGGNARVWMPASVVQWWQDNRETHGFAAFSDQGEPADDGSNDGGDVPDRPDTLPEPPNGSDWSLALGGVAPSGTVVYTAPDDDTALWLRPGDGVVRLDSVEVAETDGRPWGLEVLRDAGGAMTWDGAFEVASDWMANHPTADPRGATDDSADAGGAAGAPVELGALADGWSGEHVDARLDAASEALARLRDRADDGDGRVQAGDVRDWADALAPDAQNPDTFWRKTVRPAFKLAADDGTVEFTRNKGYRWTGE